MREYVHLHRKAKGHWVFRDPFRWHLFSFLLMEADETGRVEVSVNEYSKMFGIERTKVMRILREMVDRSIIAQQTHNNPPTNRPLKKRKKRKEKENSPHTPL